MPVVLILLLVVLMVLAVEMIEWVVKAITGWIKPDDLFLSKTVIGRVVSPERLRDLQFKYLNMTNIAWLNSLQLELGGEVKTQEGTGKKALFVEPKESQPRKWLTDDEW